MNLENYKCKSLAAVMNRETGKFTFVCEATEEGLKACKAQAEQAKAFYNEEKYIVTFFSAWIKNPTIKW